jgi:hypothetical protein
MNMSFMWPNPLEDRHKQYNRFSDLDPENGHFNFSLKERLLRDPRPIHAFMLDDGLLAVRCADDRSSVTFVFGDGLLHVFREFVVTTGLLRGLMFKHWRVDVDHVQLLLDFSVAELDNIRSDQQLPAAVNWHNDVSFETAQLGFFGEFGFAL